MTINCAERGVLLLRVRNEIRMTVAAYQALYESSMAFGLRKALQAEQGKTDMETRVRGGRAHTIQQGRKARSGWNSASCPVEGAASLK